MNAVTFDSIDCNSARATYNLEAYIRTCDVNDNVTTHVALSIWD